MTYLDGSSCDVAVMGQTSGKRRSIVEGEGGLSLGEFELLLESIDLLPVPKHLLFFLWEIWSFRDYMIVVYERLLG
jgi:hypothetical protein